MFQFIVRRVIQLIPVLIGVSIFVFSLMHITPGNPAHIIAGESAPESTVEQIDNRLGLNDPLLVQYFRFVKNTVKLDFGNSWRTSLPVITEIKSRFLVTLELAIYSTIFSIFLGLIAGIISAVRQYSFSDISIMLLALFGLSMPNFWLGLMLMNWFAIKLGWFRSEERRVGKECK